MNILPQIQVNNSPGGVTMTTPELVEFINNHRNEVATPEKPLVKLHHRSLMAKVPQVLGFESAAKFIASDIYSNGTGGSVNRQIYILQKREACLIAMSYSYELQAQIFDRMTAMEEALKRPTSHALSIPDFTDPATAARAWAEQFEAKQLAEKKIAVLAPKAEALDTIADTSNTYNIRECAKNIGIREKDLIQLLIEKKWIYRDSDRKLQPHAQYTLNKVFTNRASPVIVNKYDGQERVFLHMRVTAFGLTRITALVIKMRKLQQVAA